MEDVPAAAPCNRVARIIGKPGIWAASEMATVVRRGRSRARAGRAREARPKVQACAEKGCKLQQRREALHGLNALAWASMDGS